MYVRSSSAIVIPKKLEAFAILTPLTIASVVVVWLRRWSEASSISARAHARLKPCFTDITASLRYSITS